ncbi:hypothetical protein CDV55_102280 [Aspergillus turcosus]|nr:hypothetical protein CDV55_102280 [Aspergillus turcosus]
MTGWGSAATRVGSAARAGNVDCISGGLDSKCNNCLYRGHNGGITRARHCRSSQLPRFQQLPNNELSWQSQSLTHDASSLLLEPLPDLDVSILRTTSHALHQIQYMGALQPWANFKAEVANTYNAQTGTRRS